MSKSKEQLSLNPFLLVLIKKKKKCIRGVGAKFDREIYGLKNFCLGKNKYILIIYGFPFLNFGGALPSHPLPNKCQSVSEQFQRCCLPFAYVIYFEFWNRFLLPRRTMIPSFYVFCLLYLVWSFSQLIIFRQRNKKFDQSLMNI